LVLPIKKHFDKLPVFDHRKKGEFIEMLDSKRFINEYGYSRDFYLRNFGSGVDVVLEKPVKIRNLDLLINEFEAQPEDFKNKVRLSTINLK
jgi:hypothetical protein